MYKELFNFDFNVDFFFSMFLQRNGADFSLFLNTSSDYDGSDSGAKPDEAVSWGKIRMDATPVKITGEASILFPLLVSETFARHHFNKSD